LLGDQGAKLVGIGRGFLDKHAPFDASGVAGENFDLLNSGAAKVAPIDGVVDLGAIEPRNDGVGFPAMMELVSVANERP
jgi:hypothetical protein